MGLGGRALQPLGRLTKSTHAGSWSYRSSPPSRLASRHHDDTDPGFGLVARKCQLYRRLYMRTDPVQDGCHVTRQPGSDTVRTKDRLRQSSQYHQFTAAMSPAISATNAISCIVAVPEQSASHWFQRRRDAAGTGFGLVAPQCQLYGRPYRRIYRRPYMRTDLGKVDRTLQVSPQATRWGQKAAYV